MPALRSRPTNEAELWFPTQKGEWVLVGEDDFGQVLSQTPEQVVLKLIGGARKVYQTANFLSSDPVVLSHGFRHNISFGVDYQHQKEVTETIPQSIQAFIQDELKAEGHGELVQRLNVEFSEAAASSLDLAILVDFSGNAAPQYQVLKRLLQRLAVDACNEHGWIIPFAQMTLHVASLPENRKE
jgi:hypothetical protein